MTVPLALGYVFYFLGVVVGCSVCYWVGCWLKRVCSQVRGVWVVVSIAVAMGMVATAVSMGCHCVGMGARGDGCISMIIGHNSVYFVVFQYSWVKFRF